MWSSVRSLTVLAGGLSLMLGSYDGEGQAAGAEATFVDPVGTWQCVIYGHPALGDERVLLRFGPDGSTRLARSSEDAARPWAPLSQWQREDRTLTFSDSRTGREFEADLGRPTLGGTWQTRSLVGGWWCSPIDDADVGPMPGAAEEGTDEPALMPPLVPEVMASPQYPIEAIQRGLEGRVLVCFFVNENGAIVRPSVIEYSDEIFREPTLYALERSRYRPLAEGAPNRPACRSYIYRLDPMY